MTGVQTCALPIWLRQIGGIRILTRGDGALVALFENRYRLQRLMSDEPELTLQPILADTDGDGALGSAGDLVLSYDDPAALPAGQAALPMGAVGLLYHDLEEVPGLLREMIDHHPHYAATAANVKPGAGQTVKIDLLRLSSDAERDQAGDRRAAVLGPEPEHRRVGQPFIGDEVVVRGRLRFAVGVPQPVRHAAGQQPLGLVGGRMGGVIHRELLEGLPGGLLTLLVMEPGDLHEDDAALRLWELSTRMTGIGLDDAGRILA